MSPKVREMAAEDTETWASMRAALWPSTTIEENRKEISNILASADVWGFLALGEDDRPVGFAEVSLRRYANGCEESPVPFLEGIWVEPAFRGRGVGKGVIAHISVLFREKGFREICSDALLDNDVSHEAHRRWGFTETERVIYFRKRLL